MPLGKQLIYSSPVVKGTHSGSPLGPSRQSVGCYDHHAHVSSMHLTLLLQGHYKPFFPIYPLPELPAQPKTDDPLKCIVLAAHTPTQRKKMSYIYCLYPKWEKYKKTLSYMLSWALWEWSSWAYPLRPWLTYKMWVWVGQRGEERERKRKEHPMCPQIFQAGTLTFYNFWLF